MNHATGDKETVTRLKKIHAALNEANDRAIANYGSIDEWQSSCGEEEYLLRECYFKRITEFMKVSKVCDDSNMEACTTSLDGWNEGSQHAAVLADGTTFVIYDFQKGCNSTWHEGYKHICVDYIEVDINGKNKGKNQYGLDQFEFIVDKDAGVLPEWGEWSSTEDAAWACMNEKRGYQCTWWVLDYGNMDYLKADSEGYCNDNPKIQLDGVNNTSCH